MLVLWQNFSARLKRLERVVLLVALVSVRAGLGQGCLPQALETGQALVLALVRQLQVLAAQRQAVLVVVQARERVPVLAQAEVRLL